MSNKDDHSEIPMVNALTNEPCVVRDLESVATPGDNNPPNCDECVIKDAETLDAMVDRVKNAQRL